MSIHGELSEGNVLKGTVSGGQSLSGFTDKINVIKGESAYQLAVLNGFEGTEAEWLESLHGRDGKSAYEYAKEKGYDGTEEEFAEMLANAGSGGGGGIIEETDPTVPDWAKQPNKPSYTASEVGAEGKGAVSSAIVSHNTNPMAHNDIRVLITELANRLNALANSDDTTLDQMAEVVAYIKANRDLIDQITTGKVNTADIVNNLTTNVATKPLSAAQGVALKALIDAITVPTKLSQLTNDKGYLTGFTESDPTVPSWAKQTNKPSYTKNEVGLGNVENVKQYSASNPPPYPVTSVNGKTGAVTVDVPTKLSELDNDSGYITKAVSDLVNYYKKSEVYSKDEIDKKGFLTEHQDISGKLDASKLPEAVNDALAQAKESGEFDGEDGKTAYEYAKDGGYTGTEAEFAEKLAEESVAKNQGVENVGKILVVGTDGNLTLADMPEGGASGDVVGVLDESNNILLSGNLANGTYTLKWLNEDGTYTDAGTIEVGEIEEPEEIKNWIPISTDSSGAVFNGTGYKSGVRLKSDGVTEDTNIGYGKTCVLTGFIPVANGDVIRTQNVSFADNLSTTAYVSHLWLYGSDYGKLKNYQCGTVFNPTEANGIYTFTIPSDVSGVAYMRLQAAVLDGNSIVTKNQEIA